MAQGSLLDLPAELITLIKQRPNSSRIMRSAAAFDLPNFSACSACARRHSQVASATSLVTNVKGSLKQTENQRTHSLQQAANKAQQQSNEQTGCCVQCLSPLRNMVKPILTCPGTQNNSPAFSVRAAQGLQPPSKRDMHTSWLLAAHGQPCLVTRLNIAKCGTH